MKHSLKDIAREFLRAKSASLSEQLEVSIQIERLERELAAKEQQDETNVEELGVVDRERGWRLT